ncbi:hypothetical protein B0H15DRAFT_109634 [Mycena belliarum]|uniref:C2H2-type domain-containing protein n=1 Tax=Mycena belliarum TaxID=1033014 RepID=A0AAD6U8U7_9AGAR|nr:hypothetical protein B0H15DRAFT_109634 [Mycena belliae]
MNAGRPSYCFRGSRSTKYSDVQPLRAPDSDFALRPVSLSPPASPEPSNAAAIRAEARAEALDRAYKSASSRQHHGLPYYPKNSRHSSPATPRPRQTERFPAPPTLSVFNAPTATFLWPNFQASSQMKNGPILYASYYDRPSSPSSSDSGDSQSGSVDLRRVSSPSSSDRTVYTASGSVPRMDAPPSVFRRREQPVDIQPSDATRVHSTSVYRLDSDRHASPEPVNCSEYGRATFDIGFPPPSRQDRRSPFTIDSTSSHAGSRHPSPSASNANSTSDRMSLDSCLAPSQVALEQKPQAEWLNHTIPINTEGGVIYQCKWTTPDGPCRYSSKKQLVKRHVETTHLKIKPFLCDICKKAFPQKTSLEIHKHGHTGDTPHQCKYECGRSFKDPARRHRHHVDVHGYVPKQGKKKQEPSGARAVFV